MNKRNTKTIMVVLLIALLIMTLGYAALVQKLNITGTSKITSEWKVLITGIKEDQKTGYASTNAKDFSNTTATFDTYLVSPGDKMSYIITVENQGTLDAELESLLVTKQDNPAILFNISNVERGDVLKAGEKKEIYASVEYNGTVTTQPKNIMSSYELKLNYIQENGIDENNTIISPTTAFKFTLPDSNITTSYKTVSDVEVELDGVNLNLYGSFKKYGDQAIVKVALPQTLNDEISTAKYKSEIFGTINRSEEHNLKSVLSSSDFEKEKYMYLFITYYDDSTTQNITYKFNNETYEYKINFFQPKGA